jgi:hypothetical protein
MEAGLCVVMLAYLGQHLVLCWLGSALVQHQFDGCVNTFVSCEAKTLIQETAKGCGHNHYGEPADGKSWLNLSFGFIANFRWCLRSSQEHSASPWIERLASSIFLLAALGLVTFALSALVAPLAENPACYQNPFHRFLATGNFLSFFNLESTVTIGAAASINAASPANSP